MMRKLARAIAKRRMKREGMQHFCKQQIDGVKKDKSTFAEQWKEWVKAV